MIAPMIHTITLIIRSNQRSKREDGDKRREREREREREGGREREGEREEGREGGVEMVCKQSKSG